MTDNKNKIEQQVHDKVGAFNKRRTGIAIPAGILLTILFLWPVASFESFPTRLALLCCILFLFCSLAFVLPGKSALVSFVITTTILASLILYKQRDLKVFLILFMINLGSLFISYITVNDFTDSAYGEFETINRLKKEATTDSLTQLLNRNGLEQTLETAWALSKRDKKNVGFLLIDIDYFKSYNDTFGHLKGDNILKQVADSVKTCFKRETDIISRFGGEEFLIFLSDVDDDHMVELAKLLSATITDLEIKATADNNPCDFLSVSIGVASGVPQPHDLLTDFYIRVDEALYHAKKSGRNCISYKGTIIKNRIRQSPDNTANSVCTLGV